MLEKASRYKLGEMKLNYSLYWNECDKSDTHFYHTQPNRLIHLLPLENLNNLFFQHFKFFSRDESIL